MRVSLEVVVSELHVEVVGDEHFEANLQWVSSDRTTHTTRQPDRQLTPGKTPSAEPAAGKTRTADTRASHTTAETIRVDENQKNKSDKC